MRQYGTGRQGRRRKCCGEGLGWRRNRRRQVGADSSDGRVDASNINVDTSADTRTVVLKGTVPTAEQKATAERIAQEQAKGYKVTNTLTVAPKQ